MEIAGGEERNVEAPVDGVAVVSWNGGSTLDAYVLVMYERYTPADSEETVIARVRHRALQHLRAGQAAAPGAPPVGFEKNLFRRSRREEIGCQALGTSGHFQNVLAIGLLYAKVECREELCAVVRDNKPGVYILSIFRHHIFQQRKEKALVQQLFRLLRISAAHVNWPHWTLALCCVSRYGGELAGTFAYFDVNYKDWRNSRKVLHRNGCILPARLLTSSTSDEKQEQHRCICSCRSTRTHFGAEHTQMSSFKL